METTLLLLIVIAGTAGAGAASGAWMLACAMVAGAACGRIVRIVSNLEGA